MPSQFGPREPLGPAHRERDADAGERNRGEQQPGGRTRQALLGRAQEVPRQDDLDDRVGEHRLPPAHAWPPRAGRTPGAAAGSRRGPDRASTTIAGSSSVTAILINRSGMPQAMPSATKRISPRRVTCSFCSGPPRAERRRGCRAARYPANHTARIASTLDGYRHGSGLRPARTRWSPSPSTKAAVARARYNRNGAPPEDIVSVQALMPCATDTVVEHREPRPRARHR